MIKLAFLLLFIPSLSFSTIPRDSYIEGVPYKTQLRKFKAFAKRNSDIIKYVEIGRSHENKPIAGLLIKSRSKSKKLMVITGAIHGNEYLNIVDRLAPSLILTKELWNYLRAGGSLLFVPILNPDGYEKDIRRNALGSDLNRMWPSPEVRSKPKKAMEIFALMEWVKSELGKHQKLVLVADYHCCAGSLLTPNAQNDRPIRDMKIKTRLKAIIKSLNSSFGKDIDHKSIYEFVGGPLFGTSMHYWYIHFQALTIAFEGRQYIENNHLSQHVNWWKSILKSNTKTK